MSLTNGHAASDDDGSSTTTSSTNFSYQRQHTTNALHTNGNSTPTGTTPDIETPRKQSTMSGGMESADARRDRLLKIYLPYSARLQWLIIKSLVWIFPLELFLYMLPVFINYGVCHDMYATTADPGHRGGAIFIFAFFHFFSFVAIVSATFVLVFELGHHVVKPGHLVSMYFAIVVHYASWYQLVYAANQDSIFILTGTFAADGLSLVDGSTDLANRMVVFFYLSTAIMTTAGLGDIFPVMWWCKIIGMTQMILSLLYTTGIFGIGLDHFRQVMQRAEEQAADPTYDAAKHNRLPFQSQLDTMRNRFPILERMRVGAIKWILPLTVVIQLVLLGLLVAAYGHSGHIFGADDDTSIDANAGHGVVNFLCLLFQFFQFLIVGISSIQIIRVINAKDMSLLFLIQCYIALMALFGGIYLTIYLFVGVNGFYFNAAGFNALDQNIFKTFGEMLWFSFVVMSTLGFGDVAPVHTAARLFVLTEMLMSVFFGIVVLGIALSRTMHVWSQNRVALPALPDEGDEEEDGGGGGGGGGGEVELNGGHAASDHYSPSVSTYRSEPDEEKV